ncbi:MAG: sulfatase-like hydrolase/transferase [Planctomycetota bacterium]|jgi:arylsulfatase A-like enzyme
MNRRDFIKSLGVGLAAVLAPRCAASDEKKKLNFVFFLADDMGWRDAVCYGSTTRASIMAGKYPARMGTTDWFGAPQPETVGRHWTKNKALLPASYNDRLALKEVTMAEAFKQAGYITFFAGKWHLGGEGYFPEDQGFDINKGGHHRGSPPGGYFSPYKNPKLTSGPDGEYLTDRLTDESVKFLDTVGGKPFLLFLSHYAVHTPLQSKKELQQKYKAKAATFPAHKGPRFIPEGQRQARQVQDHAVYAGMMQSLDESLGRVMDKLQALGLDDNTAIFFMSDNGGLSTSEGSPTSNVPLRAGKGWLYEGGIREPMIVKWPGVVEPGSVCREPVTSTDFYPTMLEMAQLPLRPEQHIDGLSMVSLLKQQERNLKDDIGEKNNLAASMPAKAAELHKALEAWRDQVGARYPRKRS